MTRHLVLAAISLVAAISLITVGNAAGVVRPTLVGTVGPGFDISLTQGGRLVRTLHAGSYRLTVHDRSRIHDFHLIGPGVNRVVTSVGFRGTKTITVTLKAGRYRYICDPHAFVMHGRFRVT